MKISDNGINILKRFEGRVKIGGKHVIYDDKTGKPVDSNKGLPKGATIGYGHLIKSGEDFRDGITERQATEILRLDISMAEQAVKDNITVHLSQNQYDALVSLAGNIVLSPVFFSKFGDEDILENMDKDALIETKKMLGDTHKKKIDMSDEIFVINVGGYIGEATKSEIEYAIKTGKKVNYLEQQIKL